MPLATSAPPPLKEPPLRRLAGNGIELVQRIQFPQHLTGITGMHAQTSVEVAGQHRAGHRA